MSFDPESKVSWTTADTVTHTELNRIGNNQIALFEDDKTLIMCADSEIRYDSDDIDDSIIFDVFSAVITIPAHHKAAIKRFNIWGMSPEFLVGESFLYKLYLRASLGLYENSAEAIESADISGSFGNRYVITDRAFWESKSPDTPFYGDVLALLTNDTASDRTVRVSASVQPFHDYEPATFYLMYAGVDALIRLEAI